MLPRRAAGKPTRRAALKRPPRFLPGALHVCNRGLRGNARRGLHLEADARPPARTQVTDVEQRANKLAQFGNVVVTAWNAEERMTVAEQRMPALAHAVADVDVRQVLADPRQVL